MILKLMSNSNIPRILNCVSSKEVEHDWLLEDAASAGSSPEGDAIPSSVDLRESWWKVGDQESTGSCVGWAAAHSVLRYAFATKGRIGKDEELSVRYVWMASKETDRFVNHPTTFIENAGTSIKTALDIARVYGVVKEPVLPFTEGGLFPGRTPEFYAKASLLRIASYYNLKNNPSNWKIWLANYGPILTRLGVDETWDRISPSNPKLDVYKPHTVRGGHAIALVGYTKDGDFIVMNSWGTDWGDKGYAYASEQYAQDAFTEAYGVVV